MALTYLTLTCLALTYCHCLMEGQTRGLGASLGFPSDVSICQVHQKWAPVGMHLGQAIMTGPIVFVLAKALTAISYQTLNLMMLRIY